MILMAIAAPVSADPPSESGVVVRFQDMGFGVFPDFVNGYWVFSNVTRGDFCTWFNNMTGEPFPTGQSTEQVQLVFPSDALIVNIDAGGPTWLHAFVGPDPFINPCDGSEVEATFWGDVNVRLNDNDGPNEGKRANSFGDRGQGTLNDTSGDAYHYSWTFRGVWNPDGTEFKVAIDTFNLHQIGN
jgi:hypothetical protein